MAANVGPDKPRAGQHRLIEQVGVGALGLVVLGLAAAAALLGSRLHRLIHGVLLL